MGKLNRSRMVLMLLIIPIMISALVIPLGKLGPNYPATVKQALPGPNASFDHILVIYMENKNVGDIIGSSNAPYENTIARDYAYSQSWHMDSNSGSEPEYLAAISGQTFDSSWGACNSQPNQCSSWPQGGSTASTIMTLLDNAGIPWKDYQESATSNCQQTDAGLYATRHVPFVWFSTGGPGETDCTAGRIVATGTGESTLLNDLSSSSGPNYMFLTPNDANDMHDGSTTAVQVQNGDNYLAGLLPKVLSSYVFTHNKALVAILWDEGRVSPYIMPAIFAGPTVFNNMTSTTSYDQYSLLKTIENQWGLSSLTSNDANAAAFTEFLRPAGQTPLQASFTYTPSQPYAQGPVTFRGSATGGTSPYTFSWKFGDGSTANGNTTVHTYTSAGSYTATVFATDSAGQKANSSQTIAVTAQPPPLQVSFVYSPSQPFIFGTVTFTGSATGGVQPYSFSWNFGDGSNAAGNPTSHTYTTAGSYTATVSVRDTNGNLTTSSQTITVAAQQGFPIDPAGSWNPKVSCPSPWIVRISDITDNMTGSNSLTNSIFGPGITPPTGYTADDVKRWLTTGATPPGWVSPGPGCTMTNSKGRTVASFVEIQGVGTGGLVWENDCSSGSYHLINGGAPTPPGNWCDNTFNIFDPALVPNYSTKCQTPTDPTCYGLMHLEFDQDWMAAGYCGPSTTTCNNNTLAGLVNPGSHTTLFDFQGFVFWDPAHVTDQQHFFSGWELHALTAWRVHFPDFTISSSPTNITTLANAAATSTVTVAPADGFAGSVTLAPSVSPAGLTCTLTPANIALGASQTSTLSCSGPAGVYTVTVTGTSGTITHTATVTYTVQDFTVAAAPVSVTVNAGSPGTSTISVSALNGFTGAVNLATNSTSCTVNPTSVTSSGTSTLSCTFTTVGTFHVMVTGTSGTLSRSATATYTVQDFTIAASPTSVTVSTGSVGISAITITGLNGFAGVVNLANNSTSCTLSPTSLTGSGSATLSCAFVSASTVRVGVTGASSSLSHNVTIAYVVQDFTITTSPTIVTTNAGVAGTSTITVAPLNGFAGTVTLAVTTNSTNLSCTLTSTSVLGGSGTSTLSCTGSVAGNYLATVTGTSGALSRPSTVSYHVQDYTIVASPTNVSVNAGVAGTSTVTEASVNGFAGTVTLDVTTNSTNLSCTLASSSITGGAGTSNLSCTGSPAGNYLVTVTGTSGTLSHFLTVTYHVQDFTVTASPTSVTMNVGVAGTSIITAAPVNGFTGTVTLAVTTNSTNLVCTLTSTSITGGSGASTLSCTGGAAGNYLATVTGTSQTLSHSATVTYHVQDFTVSASVSSVTVNVGVAGTSTVTVTPINGFTGTVSFLVTTNATNLSCILDSATVTGGSGASTLSCTGTVTGNYAASITGTSVSLSHSVAPAVVYHVQDYTVAASPTNVNANAGATVTSIITVSALNGFTGTVTLALATNSTNLVCTVSTTSITGGSGVSTLSCQGSPAGNYLGTVTGASGTLSHSATVTFQVQDFSVIASVTSITLNANVAGTSTTTVAPVNGFAGAVALAVATNSTNLSCTLSSTSIAGGSGTSILSCSASIASNYLATVTGTNAAVSHSAVIAYHVQDFTIATGSPSVSVNVGVAGTSTITIAPVNAFVGTVTLAVTTNSTNLSCTLTSTSIVGGSGPSTLFCTGSIASNYLATVTGTSGTLTHSATVTYHIQDFTVSTSPTSLTVNAGVAGTSGMMVASFNGFAGTVTLALSTNSTNLSCNLTSTSVTGGSGTSTLSCTGSPEGNYLATVTGTSGTLSHSSAVVYHVQDFAISAGPASVTVNAGVGAISTMTVAPLNGFTGTVTLAFTTNSTNLSCALSSTSITGGSGSSTLSCSASIAANYLVTVAGTNGTLSHSAAVTYHVQDYTLTASPTSVNLNAGATSASTITITPLNGFTGTVTLAVTTNSTNLVCTLTVISINGGSGISTLSCNGSLAGNYNAAVAGTSATLSHPASVVFHTQDFAVTDSATSVTLNAGVAGASIITVAPLNGFVGTVTLAVTTNSTNLSCILNATSINGGSGTSTPSCTGSLAGDYLATVTGTNASLSHSATVTFHVQDYTLTASIPSVTLNAGVAGTATMTVAPIDGFAGTVTLGVTTNSTNLSCTLSSISIAGGSGTSTLSCAGSVAGNYLATITGTSGTLSHSSAVTDHVQDFTISASPTISTMNAGVNATSIIAVVPVNGFAGAVNLVVATNSTNISCTLTAMSITGGSGTSALSCVASPASNYQATVTTTSGALSHSMTVTYHVQDFVISASPTSVILNAGVTGTSTITVAPVNGFAGSVTLSVTTNSTSLSCTLTSTTVTGGSGTSALSCTGSSASNYLSTVTGTSGTLSHSATFTYHVQDFTVTASPTSATVNTGVAGTSTITVASLNGFSGTVTLAFTTNSTNLACTLTAISIPGGSGTSTLFCSGTPAGNYVANVTGTTGTLFRAAGIVYHVQDFAISANPTGLSVNAGAAGASTITVGPVTGFSGTVTLAVTTNSTSLVCTLTATSITGGSGTSVLSCHGSPARNYLATVTGTSGALSHSATVAYHVQSFVVSANPMSMTVNAGLAGTLTIAVTPVNGFIGTVTLAVTTNSTNASCSLTSSSITGGSGTTTLSCTGSSAGNYLATVTGTSGNLSYSASVVYLVQDFSFTANPLSITSIAGSAPNSTITVSSLVGFSGNVNLAAIVQCSDPSGGVGGGGGHALEMAPMPSCPALSLSPAAVFLSAGASVFSVLTVNGSGVPAGNYMVTVTATSGILVHSVLVNVTFTNSGVVPQAPSLTADSGSNGGSTSVIGGFTRELLGLVLPLLALVVVGVTSGSRNTRTRNASHDSFTRHQNDRNSYRFVIVPNVGYVQVWT